MALCAVVVSTTGYSTSNCSVDVLTKSSLELVTFWGLEPDSKGQMIFPPITSVLPRGCSPALQHPVVVGSDDLHVVSYAPASAYARFSIDSSIING